MFLFGMFILAMLTYHNKGK
nr:putative holin-like toxin [Paenibacillus ehimensis]